MTQAQLEHKLSQNPNSPVFLRLASEYLSQGKIADAKALCISGLENYPSYPTGYLILAKCLATEEDYTSALISVRTALKILPTAQVLLDLQVEYHEKVDPSVALNEAPQPPAEAETATADERPDELSSEIAFTSPVESQSEQLLSEGPLRDQPTEIADAVVTELSVESFGREEGLEPGLPPPGEAAGLNERLSMNEGPEPEKRSERMSGDAETEIAAFFDRREVPGTDEELTTDSSIETPSENEQLEKPAIAETADLMPGETGFIEHSTIDLPHDELMTDSVPVESLQELLPGEPSEVRSEARLAATVRDAVVIEARLPGVADGDPLPLAEQIAPQENEGSGTSLGEENTLIPPTGAPPFNMKPKFDPPPHLEDEDVNDETSVTASDGRIVSRTLAEIYAAQGAIVEAILTYQLLKAQRPELRSECEARIRELEPRLQEKPSV